MEEILKRLISFIGYSNIKNRELSEIFRVNPKSVSNILGGRVKVDVPKLIELKKFHPELSLEWLVCGNGPMLLTSDKGGVIVTTNGNHNISIGGNANNSTLNTGNNDAIEDVEVEELPVIPNKWVRKADFNIMDNLFDEKFQHEVDKVPALVSEFDGELAVFKNPSDAMYPYIPRGARCLLRRSKCERVINGEIYAIDTKEQGMIIRFVTFVHDEEKGDYILCRAMPENRERFGDMMVKVEDVESISKVLQYKVTL